MIEWPDQRDFGIAVQDALRVDECLNALWETLAGRPEIKGDERHYFSHFDMLPRTEESIAKVHRRNSEDLAVVLLRTAVAEKRLPVWLRLIDYEALADAAAFHDLDVRTWTGGFFRSHARYNTNLEGRPLWIKRPDWDGYMSWMLRARYGEVTPHTDAAEIGTRREPWSEEDLSKAIAECGINNRERAWKEHFQPIRNEHGWGNEAFRVLWPKARGTKGMTGRPSTRG